MVPFKRSEPCRNVTSQLILSDSGAAAATGCDREEVVGTTSSASSVMGSSSSSQEFQDLPDGAETTLTRRSRSTDAGTGGGL